MNKTRLSLGIILTLVGAVWALQGLDAGFVPEGAMTGETTWIVLGSLAVVFGLVLIWRSRNPNESSDPVERRSPTTQRVIDGSSYGWVHLFIRSNSEDGGGDVLGENWLEPSDANPTQLGEFFKRVGIRLRNTAAHDYATSFRGISRNRPRTVNCPGPPRLKAATSRRPGRTGVDLEAERGPPEHLEGLQPDRRPAIC